MYIATANVYERNGDTVTLVDSTSVTGETVEEMLTELREQENRYAEEEYLFIADIRMFNLPKAREGGI